MAHVLQHRHLVVSALINKPPTENDVPFMTEWFKDLVLAINMKILMGPYVVYSNMEGNKGFTGITVIETSHAAMHVWDEIEPAKMELDVYTCSPLDINVIFEKMKVFEPAYLSYIYLNRNDGIKVINQTKQSRFNTIQWE